MLLFIEPSSFYKNSISRQHFRLTKEISMKFLFVMLSALTLNHAAQAADPLCYPFQQNDGNYSKICVLYANPANLDTLADLFVYQGDSLKYSLKGNRKYYPKRTGCFGKEHDCRELPSSLLLSAQLDQNGVKIDFSAQIFQAATEKCRSGYVTFRTPQGYSDASLQCPSVWW
jgi:hypothetical protein